MKTRKTLLPLLVCALLALGCRHLPPSPDTHVGTEIHTVLDQQLADWNAGNIEGFMQGYAKSQSTRFASGNDVTRGWQTVFDRYRAHYGDRAAMGRLSFSELEITPISPTIVEVFGHWRLERQKDSPQGLFTLLFRKTARGWRIIHDHTSAATP